MPQSRAPQQSCGRLQASFGGLQSGPPNKKKAASVTLRPLYYPKAIQEQQTQGQSSTDGWIAQVISFVVLEEAQGEVTPARPPTGSGQAWQAGDSWLAPREAPACTESVTPCLPESVDL